MTASRRALNAFLLRYPLCYGYWKKFADMERRAGNNVKAEEVREGTLCVIDVNPFLFLLPFGYTEV